MPHTLNEELDEIWLKALENNLCRCGNDDNWVQEIKGDIKCIECNQVVA
ncbi:hypothetical protein [Lederbergia galactosidilytica]|nr:hypothetical protein [Lederbergia galactosidilytica]